jgi:thiol-disulfide isomerase/thioredoxin
MKVLNKKINSTVILFCTLILLLAGHTAMAATAMPHFALPSVVDGKTVNSDEFKNKVLLITFFATWCPPCRQEIPALIELQNELSDKGFSIIGLSVDEGGAGIVAKLVNQQKINYPVLLATGATARDFGGIPGIPTSFLINRQGNVVKSYPGYVPHKLLMRDIESVMR